MEERQSPVAPTEPDLHMRTVALVERDIQMVLAMLENMRMSRDE